MKFESIRGENYCSYKHLNLDISKLGKLFTVTGYNGSGKTTLFKSFSVLLWEQTPIDGEDKAGISKFVRKVSTWGDINLYESLRKKKQLPILKLEGILTQGPYRYRVVRTFNPNVKQGGHMLSLQRKAIDADPDCWGENDNVTVLTERTIAETQKHIEELFGNFKSFITCTFMSHGISGFLNATDDECEEVAAYMFGAEGYDKRQSVAREKRKILENSISDTLSRINDINTNPPDIANLESEIALLEREKKDLDEKDIPQKSKIKLLTEKKDIILQDLTRAQEASLRCEDAQIRLMRYTDQKNAIETLIEQEVDVRDKGQRLATARETIREQQEHYTEKTELQRKIDVLSATINQENNNIVHEQNRLKREIENAETAGLTLVTVKEKVVLLEQTRKIIAEQQKKIVRVNEIKSEANKLQAAIDLEKNRIEASRDQIAKELKESETAKINLVTENRLLQELEKKTFIIGDPETEIQNLVDKNAEIIEKQGGLKSDIGMNVATMNDLRESITALRHAEGCCPTCARIFNNDEERKNLIDKFLIKGKTLKEKNIELEKQMSLITTECQSIANQIQSLRNKVVQRQSMKEEKSRREQTIDNLSILAKNYDVLKMQYDQNVDILHNEIYKEKERAALKDIESELSSIGFDQTIYDSALETERLHSKYEGQIDHLEAMHKTLVQLCPKLAEIENQLKNYDYCHEERKEIKRLNNDIANTGYDQDVYGKALGIERELNGYDALLAQIEKADADLVIMQKNIAAEESEISRYKELADTKIEKESLLKKLRTDIDALIQDQEQYSCALDTNKWNLLRKKDELESAVNADREKENLILKTADTQRQIAVYRALEDAFDPCGIPNMIYGRSLPSLTNKVNHVLSVLNPGWSISITSEINSRGKFIIKRDTMDDKGIEHPYLLRSSGERFIISLSFLIGIGLFWNEKTGSSPEQKFIDEGIEALDSVNVEKAKAALAIASNNFAQIGIISHIPEITSIGQSQLQVYNDRENGSIFEMVGTGPENPRLRKTMFFEPDQWSAIQNGVSLLQDDISCLSTERAIEVAVVTTAQGIVSKKNKS